jgi:hypothetical protein|tara:strand:- start:325 stop:447 length:123 start_codon:yes stop_codon:yes gene_type:complete
MKTIKTIGVILLSIAIYGSIAFMALCYLASPTISGEALIK